MKNRNNNKLFKAMMLGAMALLMISAHRASAAESIIYKCSNPKGHIVFQDFACEDDQLLEMLRVKPHQSADIDTGLREYEKVVLSRSFQRQMLELMLQSKAGTPILVIK